MAQKRLCDAEIVDRISPKHPRYMENDDRNLTHVSSSEDVFEKLYLSGKFNSREDNFEGHLKREDSGNENVGDPVTASLPSCAINDIGERRVHELVAHFPFPPEYFYPDCSVRRLHYDDPYSSMLTSTPRKSVPVGPAHQADIPELSDNSPTEEMKNELAGTCIMPSRELDEASPSNNVEAVVGAGRARNCDCPDMGSAKCVNQHITEAREKLKGALGAKAFKELGFYEMGEVVADEWHEKDEVLYHKIVHSNPSSSGRNFWNILRLAFPSRTHMEIVRYYFNILILRKRAAQNRYDPMNIDSDDDEWQLIEDNEHDDTEARKTDEENDSAVEHHSGSDALACYSDDVHGLDEHIDDDNNSHESFPSQHPSSHLDKEQEQYGDSGDNDVQDGSCTSFDFGSPVQLPAEVKADCHKDWHSLVLEPCYGKGWERYPSCTNIEVADFLPTYSVIEEVFGDGSS